MKNLHINFEHCYGIKELEYKFDFTEKNTCIVYAPNGVMKTSFANTFKDYSAKKDSKDQIFQDRETVRIIQDELGNEIPPEDVFVIQPYDKDYSTDKVMTLLVTKELKERYDKIYTEIEKYKSDFVTQLKSTSKSTDCEYELISTFKINEKTDLLQILEEIAVNITKDLPNYDFKYNDVFDKGGKVAKFLNEYRPSLDSYIKNYEDIIVNSEFFNKSNNTFGTLQASSLSKSIEDNSFFEAGHKLELRNNQSIVSASQYFDTMTAEIEKVVNDPKLKKAFDKIDKALAGNAELRSFKKVIEQNNLLLIELKDYSGFKKKVWFGYLSILKNDLDKLVDQYKLIKSEIEKIVSEAKEQRTDWEKSILEFNDRFLNLPFQLHLSNREDVLLKTDTPNIEFIFKDIHSHEEQVIEREKLNAVLSQGEKRALYLLNIIFEIRARKNSGRSTLLIIDDIADSFDYKNKYAIVEYLNDITGYTGFNQIILTHNFDFFRTLFSRILSKKCLNNYLVASRKMHALQLHSFDADYITNPFLKWKKDLSEINPDHDIESIAMYLIPLIPFVRNLLEYTGSKNSKDYNLLTYLLHIKMLGNEEAGLFKTKDIQIKDLEDSFRQVIPNIDLSRFDVGVLDTIYLISHRLVESSEENFRLESKIVLSIAIRLKTEEYLIFRLSNLENLTKIKYNQTNKLVSLFRKHFVNETEILRILDQVSLMTPENIHLNSFMYEPIMDLGDDHLKCLYHKVDELVGSFV